MDIKTVAEEKDNRTVVETNDVRPPPIASDSSIAVEGIVGVPILVPPFAKPTKMHNLWAQELMELGFNERQANEENLHGIRSQAVNETPEVLYKGLNEMQKEIDNIPDEEKLSHLRGLEMGSMYIQSLAFRLKFLRCVQFKASVAALRYVKFLDYLSELFGEAVLMRRLYITDLGKEELEYLKEGQYQVLPSRDVLGRRIAVFNIHPTKRTYSMDTMFKVYIYMMDAVLSEDVSTQKHGIVYIGLLVRTTAYQNEMDFSSSNLHWAKLMTSIPLYWGAVHLCVPSDGLYRLITAFFMAWIGAAGRKVMRVHHGNRMECNYQLKSYGIPVDVLPYMYSGVIKTKNHMRLFKVRMSMDEWDAEQEKRSKTRRKDRKSAPESSIPFPGIECPEIDFVVLPGKRNDEGVQKNHPGYVAFRKIMAESEGFKRYLLEDLIEQSEVLKVVEDILYDACMHGLKFLVFNKEQGYYTEVINEKKLRDNIELAMRRYKILARKKAACTKNKQSSETPLQETLDLSDRNPMDCSDCII